MQLSHFACGPSPPSLPQSESGSQRPVGTCPHACVQLWAPFVGLGTIGSRLWVLEAFGGGQHHLEKGYGLCSICHHLGNNWKYALGSGSFWGGQHHLQLGYDLVLLCPHLMKFHQLPKGAIASPAAIFGFGADAQCLLKH